MASVTQTQGCVEESEDVVSGGDTMKLFSPLISFSSLSHQAGPKASGVHQQLSCRRLSKSLHLQSNSIKSRPAANKP